MRFIAALAGFLWFKTNIFAAFRGRGKISILFFS